MSDDRSPRADGAGPADRQPDGGERTDGPRPSSAQRSDGGVGYAEEALGWHDEPTAGGWLRPLATVAAQEYRLSVRNRWAPALAGVFGLLALLVTVFGATSVGPGRVDAVVVSLAALATYLVPLAALVFGYDAVVGAEEAGWLDVVFALPVPRGVVVVGSYLGRAVTLAAATVLGFGAAGVLLAALAGLADWALFLRLLFGAVGLGLAFLAVGTLVSALAPGKTHALGGVLVVWVWFAFLHDLLALALVAAVELPPAALSAAVLLNPAAVFRVVVLSGVGSAGGGLAAVVATTGLSLSVLAAGTLAWVVLPTLAAARAARRRSL